MKLSQRALEVEPFHALAFGQQAAALEAQGHHVVRLGIGEPDFGAPPAVREAMRAVMDGRPLPYTIPMGLPTLREAIAGFYKDRHAVNVDPARIIITSGASAGLLAVTAATTDPGDEVILADPSYPCNRAMVQSFGGTVVALPSTAETRYQLAAAAVEAAWTERTSAVMVASPSNPTGTSITNDELAAICNLARERGAWRIVDEIYLNLSDDAPQSVLSADPEAIVINSFSKYFGMTGWRLGWVVLPEVLVPAVEKLAMNYFLCASTPTQHAALAAFTPESLAVCEERRAELAARRALVLDGLERIGLPVPALPDGAFYVYFDVAGTGLSAWEFCARALAEQHVALTPGTDFGSHTADTHVRLSYAASRDELREGLARLERFLTR
ncbi:aminotransferase class I/II-fold pyridoxal phosphate-dependent enzyme [Solirubrobacter sp. CPCC 204708]|uniref:Aminotransferase n=1 Tax=Solirubrobacter deserti TaxID=2282478 RepID=A0ABT4RKA4_9ACTN|nr:aminotransferase class I/II-fold pyridoxal phosphate-dependent enzyme [Solirubrobacter deserti]MBE2315780.1 aminotransferase class I/II-fold pyridoxal phosphate-dependent enzyme [Solirubrobacter deserti]MDA0138883.1 aminotransferase class I/II-fold pyridoxal phosphate-dependent enzyme [Solirubrobacter deserti]